MSTEQIGRDFAAPGNRALALATILAAQLMLQMDFLIVIVALPRIQADLGFTPAGLSWVPNAFALAFGGLLLLGGRLGDMFGQVKAFQAGLAVFVLASLLGGADPGPVHPHPRPRPTGCRRRSCRAKRPGADHGHGP